MRGPRSWKFVWLAVLFATGGCSSHHSDTVDRELCEEYRDHVVDVRLSTASNLGTAEIEKHRKALRNALNEPFLAKCQQTLTRSQINCGLESKTSAGLSACETKKAAL